MASAERGTRHRQAMWALLAANAVVVAAHFVASFSFSNWSWGFNHYSLLAPPWRYAAFLAWCILGLPWVWTRMSSLGRSGGRGMASERPTRSGTRAAWLRRNRLQIVTAAICALVFWALRMPNHLLGDGRLLIRLLEQGQWFDPAAPLDRLAHYGLLRGFLALGGRAAIGAEAVYAAASVAAGVAYALAAMRLGTLIGQRVAATACLLTLGTAQLFFGYAESYSLAVVMMVVYFVLALEYLEGRRRLAWVAAALLAGAGFHYALVLLVPSFVYLVALGRKRTAAFGSLALGVGVLAALLAYFLLAMRRPGQDDLSLLVVPLAPNPVSQYTFFSWRHLADLINLQTLVSPLAWLGAAALGLAVLARPALGRSPRFRFLAVAGASGALYSVLLRPGLGGSRDWDLWAMGSVPYVIAVVAWISRGISGGIARRREFQYAAYLLALTGFFHTAPWVAVNHSAQLSLRHFNLMLDDNPLWTRQRVAAAHNELGSFYVEKGSLADASGHIEKAVALEPDKAKYWLSLGLVEIMAGKRADAEKALRRAIALDPASPTAYNNLGRLCLEQGRTLEAERALARAIQLDPDQAPAHFNLGSIYESRGDLVGAVRAYREAARIQPANLTYWYRLAKALDRAPGEEADALAAWKRTAELARRDPAAAGLAAEAGQRLHGSGDSGTD
ncbi:MAG: tetratricopeptide repeat protein [bacterium]